MCSGGYIVYAVFGIRAIFSSVIFLLPSDDKILKRIPRLERHLHVHLRTPTFRFDQLICPFPFNSTTASPAQSDQRRTGFLPSLSSIRLGYGWTSGCVLRAAPLTNPLKNPAISGGQSSSGRRR